MMYKIILLCLLVCVGRVNVIAQKKSSYHFSSDDSTLQQQGPFTLMPFNRLVRSAGEVVTFGDPLQENHAMDVSILPDSQHIAIEDRSGIAILDIHSRQIVHRWEYRTG